MSIALHSSPASSSGRTPTTINGLNSGHASVLRVAMAPLVFVALIALTGLGACKSTPKVADCNDSKSAYLHAQEHALLQSPDGLEAPDRSNALTIPAAKTEQHGKHACLDHPPSYFGTAGRIAASPEETVADWAQAWADRNVDAVLAMYSSTFGADTPNNSGNNGAAILEQRRAEVANGPAAGARVKNLKITQPDNDRRTAQFTQQFGGNAVQKELSLIRDGGVWKIADEKVITVN